MRYNIRVVRSAIILEFFVAYVVVVVTSMLFDLKRILAVEIAVGSIVCYSACNEITNSSFRRL